METRPSDPAFSSKVMDTQSGIVEYTYRDGSKAG